MFRKKVDQLNHILSQEDVDLWELREMGLTPGGFVNDEIRRKAWPRLAGIAIQKNTTRLPPLPPLPRSWRPVNEPSRVDRRRNLPATKDLEQIELDVTRCTHHLLTGLKPSPRMQVSDWKELRLRRIRFKQRQLASLIHLTLLKSYPDCRFRYYQGYHDVASIFLSTLTAKGSPETVTTHRSLSLPALVLQRVSRSHFRDCLKPDFLELKTCLQMTLFPLLARVDPLVDQHLSAGGVDPFFACSWILTWFSRDIKDSEMTKCIFDAFLVSHHLMPVYVAVAMLSDPINRQQVLSTECDFACLYEVLRSLPNNSLHMGEVRKVSQSGSSPQAILVSDPIPFDGLEDEPLRPRFDSNLDDGFDSGSESSVATDYAEQAPLVPFQTLIDSAVRLMDHVPPSDLVALARWYHGDEKVEKMVREAPCMTMLENPAPWTISGRIGRDLDDGTVAAPDHRYLQRQPDRLAVIAAGFGVGDIARRKKKKLRRRMILLTLVFLEVLVLVNYVKSRLGFSLSKNRIIRHDEF